MIQVTAQTRVLVAVEPVDFPISAQGLIGCAAFAATSFLEIRSQVRCLCSATVRPRQSRF